MLCYCRNEVDQVGAIGKPVIFVISNRGDAADKLRISLVGKPLEIVHEPAIDAAHGLVAFAYDYDPAMHGRDMVLEVWFQSRSGFEDTHRYRTRHGFRVLERIDPP